jgi:hypothetical protein
VEIAEGTTETVNKLLSILSRFSAGTFILIDFQCCPLLTKNEVSSYRLLHYELGEVFINFCDSSMSYFNGITIPPKNNLPQL